MPAFSILVEKPKFWNVLGRFRSTRSKREIQDKITELMERFDTVTEGRNTSEAEDMRLITVSKLQALDWVIKDRGSL